MSFPHNISKFKFKKSIQMNNNNDAWQMISIQNITSTYY